MTVINDRTLEASKPDMDSAPTRLILAKTPDLSQYKAMQSGTALLNIIWRSRILIQTMCSLGLPVQMRFLSQPLDSSSRRFNDQRQPLNTKGIIWTYYIA